MEAPLRTVKVSNRLFKKLYDRLRTSMIVAVAPYNSSSDPKKIPFYMTDMFWLIDESERPEKSDPKARILERARTELPELVSAIKKGAFFEYVNYQLAMGKSVESIESVLVPKGYRVESIRETVEKIEREELPEDISIVRVGIKKRLERKLATLVQEYDLKETEVNALIGNLRAQRLLAGLKSSSLAARLKKEEGESALGEITEKCGAIERQYRDIIEIEKFYQFFKSEGNGITVIEAENKKTLYVVNSSTIPSIEIPLHKGGLIEHRGRSEALVREHYKKLAVSLERKVNDSIAYAISMLDVGEGTLSESVRAGEGTLSEPEDALPPLETLTELFHDPQQRSFLYSDPQVAAYFRGTFNDGGELVNEGALTKEEMLIRQGNKLIEIGEAKQTLAQTTHQTAEQIKAELKGRGFGDQCIGALGNIIQKVVTANSPALTTQIQFDGVGDVNSGNAKINAGNEKIRRKVNGDFIKKALTDCVPFIRLLGDAGVDYQHSVTDLRNTHIPKGSNLDFYVCSIADGLKSAEETEKDDDALFGEYISAYKSLRYLFHNDIGNPLLLSLEKKIKNLTYGLDPAMLRFGEESSFYNYDRGLADKRAESITGRTAQIIIKTAVSIHNSIQKTAKESFKRELGEADGDILDLVEAVEDPVQKITLKRKLNWLANKVITASLDEAEPNDRQYITKLFSNVRFKLGYLVIMAQRTNEYVRKARGQAHSDASYSEGKNQLSLISGVNYPAEVDNFLMRLSVLAREV